MRAKFEIFGEPGLFFEEADGLSFYDGTTKTSFAIMDGADLMVFVVGLLQVFIVNISKLLKCLFFISCQIVWIFVLDSAYSQHSIELL